jgi:hypothetical protein
MPDISYGVLDSGEIGRYQTGRLGKSSIILNHSLIDAPPSAQAAVLAHELFHYWDFELSWNFHEVASNYFGYVAPENKPALEYVPYSITKAFWKQSRPEAPSSEAASPLEQEIQSMPEPDGIRPYVDKILKERESK